MGSIRKYRKFGPSALFARFGTLWLLASPKNKNCNEMKYFFYVSDIQKQVAKILKSILEFQKRNSDSIV